MRGRHANHRLIVAAGAVVALAVALLTWTPLTGQSPATGANGGNWKISRLPDGTPDLQGIRIYADATPMETAGVPTRRRSGESRETAGAGERVAGRRRLPRAGSESFGDNARSDRNSGLPARRSLVVYPPDGKVPVLPAAVDNLNYLLDHFYDSYVYWASSARCITRGVPGTAIPSGAQGVNNALQIVQSPGYVGIVYEFIHETRIIPTDGRPHISPRIRHWNGDSRGRWEGDTFVVDITNYNTRGSVTNSANMGHLQGLRQSEALHVVERFTRVSADRINYELSIEDPNVYSGPWKVELPLTRDDEYTMYEYACHEGNYGLTVALRSGRVNDGTLAAPATDPTILEAQAAAAAGKGTH